MGMYLFSVCMGVCVFVHVIVYMFFYVCLHECMCVCVCVRLSVCLSVCVQIGSGDNHTFSGLLTLPQDTSQNGLFDVVVFLTPPSHKDRTTFEVNGLQKNPCL